MSVAHSYTFSPPVLPPLSLFVFPKFFSSPKMRGTMFPFDQISVPMSSHRQKNIELHRIFSSLDSSEKLIDGMYKIAQSCACVHSILYVYMLYIHVYVHYVMRYACIIYTCKHTCMCIYVHRQICVFVYINCICALLFICTTSTCMLPDYSCALQRDILVHGRLFVTQNWLCFYANIFTWETLVMLISQHNFRFNLHTLYYTVYMSTCISLYMYVTLYIVCTYL